MKIVKHALLLFISIALVTGCGVDKDAQDNMNDDKNKVTDNQNANNNQVDDNNGDVTDEKNTVESKMEVADEAQNKIENLKEVNHANVIVTNENAYVAVVLNNAANGDLRKDVETKISNQVKSIDNTIHNVFVSSNPDFVNSMGDYGDRLRAGQPIKGFFNEFDDMVRRVFPNAN
jgi:YhcN/YlaJ family sporulation lipoprotein